MTLFLGIDGGGTNCRAALADADGRVIGRGDAGAANIWSDPETAQASIIAASEAALAAAGRSAGLADLCAVLGLAGANLPEPVARLRAALPFRALRIESDAMIALKGALGAEDGVAAILGTGSIFGVQRGGRAVLRGGWGFLLGDHGSGARLGRALMEAALLAHDGFIPDSPLLAATVVEAGGPEALVASTAGAVPGDFAARVPRLLEAERNGDAGAAAIMAESTAEVARALDRLRGGTDLPVCFLGGLGPVHAARLAERYRGAMRQPKGSALDGALAMARDLA